jgi:hypothetical protein
MRYLCVLVLLLAGCADAPYDEQFCKFSTERDGVVRCREWQFGPSKEQQLNFRRHGL